MCVYLQKKDVSEGINANSNIIDWNALPEVKLETPHNLRPIRNLHAFLTMKQMLLPVNFLPKMKCTMI